MPMSAAVESYLQERDIPFHVLAHPATETSMQTAHSAHISPAHLVKSVVLWTGENFIVCLVPACNRLVLRWVDRQLGCKHRLATESEVLNLFAGCEPGAIPALADAFNLDVCWDEALQAMPELYFEGGDHRHIIQIDGDQFRSLLPASGVFNMSCSPENMEFYHYIH